MSEDEMHGLPRWEPAAEEIAAETAKIRATWSQAERRRRCLWAHTGPVRAVEVSLDEGEAGFA